MPWTDDWAELRSSVLEQIVPGNDERERVEATCRQMEEELTVRLRDAGLRAVAEAHGSVAHGTWLAGERDIDVFLVLDGDYDRGVLPRVLDIVKGYVGEGWVEAYAEHPYVSALVDGFNVDFVPCFRVDPRRGLISSTDRTPLHTGYLREHLRAGMQDEVRLLKKFMKGVGVYGAEVRVGGFSGYLCELLVISFGSFEGVIEGASKWERRQVLDLVVGVEEDALRKKFGDPLIVVDPVDANRNVASAVSETSFWTLIAAARTFIRRPGMKFFKHGEEVDAQKLTEKIKGWESALLFLVIDDDDVAVPDVLWGQLYRTERALRRLLEKHDFGVMRCDAWSDDSSRHFLVFELESAVLSGTVKRAGPPVGMEEDGDRFLRAHLGAADTVSGPWIEGDRWWVETRRPEPDARRLLSSTLEDGGRGTGVSRKLMEKIRRGHRVLLGEEIAGFLDQGFAGFLDRFLKGRPAWLE